MGATRLSSPTVHIAGFARLRLRKITTSPSSEWRTQRCRPSSPFRRGSTKHGGKRPLETHFHSATRTTKRQNPLPSRPVVSRVLSCLKGPRPLLARKRRPHRRTWRRRPRRLLLRQGLNRWQPRHQRRRLLERGRYDLAVPPLPLYQSLTTSTFRGLARRRARGLYLQQMSPLQTTAPS